MTLWYRDKDIRHHYKTRIDSSHLREYPSVHCAVLTYIYVEHRPSTWGADDLSPLLAFRVFPPSMAVALHWADLSHGLGMPEGVHLQ